MNSVENDTVRCGAPVDQNLTRRVGSGRGEREDGVVAVEVTDDKERETGMSALCLGDDTKHVA